VSDLEGMYTNQKLVGRGLDIKYNKDANNFVTKRYSTELDTRCKFRK
jgi:hypothetical protein